MDRIEFSPEFSKFFDTSLDADFFALDLKWLPWVGAAYASSAKKTLILGESLYDYSEGNEVKKARIISCDSLRHRQVTHGILAKEKTRYLRNFERAVFVTRSPTADQRASLWTGVAFHNLVNRLLVSSKDRPTPEDYLTGWRSTLKVIGLLKVDNCVVYGLESKKISALRLLLGSSVIRTHENYSAIGSHRPIKLSFDLDGRTVSLLFIRHPSAFFKWRQWGSVLRDSSMFALDLGV